MSRLVAIASRTSGSEIDAGHVKGAALREFLVWLEQTYGRERLDAIARRLPHEVHAALRLDVAGRSLGVLSSRWYPADAIHALFDVVFDGLDPDERRALVDRSADAVMAATLHGVYQVLFKWLATPERYARFAERLWSSYYDTGAMRVVQASPARAVCTITDWRSHHPAACDMNRAAAEAIYRAMGCRGVVTVRECCVTEGARECRFVTTWDARDGEAPT
jgi:hypothetical protein